MYKRQRYLDSITPFIDKPFIKVISGMRRTGKSTILQQIMENLVVEGADRERVVYINMESLDNACFRDISVLHQLIKKKKAALGEQLYLFIDEVQEIPDWEKAVNSFLADGDADIFITGSNSKLLAGERRTTCLQNFCASGGCPASIIWILMRPGLSARYPASISGERSSSR